MTGKEFARLYECLWVARVKITSEGKLVRDKTSRLSPALRAFAEEAQVELARFAQGLCWRCGATLITISTDDTIQQWCSEDPKCFSWSVTVPQGLPDGFSENSLSFELGNEADRVETPLGLALTDCLRVLREESVNGEEASPPFEPILPDEWPDHL
jgi:hypothetical protein